MSADLECLRDALPYSTFVEVAEGLKDRSIVWSAALRFGVSHHRCLLRDKFPSLTRTVSSHGGEVGKIVTSWERPLYPESVPARTRSWSGAFRSRWIVMGAVRQPRFHCALCTMTRQYSYCSETCCHSRSSRLFRKDRSWPLCRGDRQATTFSLCLVHRGK